MGALYSLAIGRADWGFAIFTRPYAYDPSLDWASRSVEAPGRFALLTSCPAKQRLCSRPDGRKASPKKKGSLRCKRPPFAPEGRNPKGNPAGHPKTERPSRPQLGVPHTGGRRNAGGEPRAPGSTGASGQGASFSRRMPRGPKRRRSAY